VRVRTVALAAVVVFVVQFAVRGLVDDANGFLTIALNGLTLGALYFLVASGFSLIFGLMRVTNLAHGAFYLLGGYIGFAVVDGGAPWIVGVLAATAVIAVLGVASQQLLLRRIQGQDLREALITLGLAIVIADQCLAVWGGTPRDIQVPESLSGAKSLGAAGLIYPTYRLFILVLAIAVGLGLWALLRHTRLGITIRRALLTDPKLVIMDERSEGLAPALVEELVATLAALAGEGLRMQIVEQNLGVATALAQRLLIMLNGRIVDERTPAALDADAAAKQRYLGVTPRIGAYADAAPKT
jgi:branched-chain amino acid transport system permease protein